MKTFSWEKYWKNRKPNDPHDDWNTNKKWIDGYWESQNHPHRKELIDAIQEMRPFGSILEVGCSCAPNLALIKKEFLNVEVAGIDINKYVIEEAKRKVPEGNFKVAKADKLPFPDKSFDIVFTDAVLMYVDDKKIVETIREFLRVAKKALIFVEWHSYIGDGLGKEKIIKDYYQNIYVRNYKRLMELFGENAEMSMIKNWPSENWQKYGEIIRVRL